MALTEEQLKAELESYFKKLAGVMPIGHYWLGIDPKSKPAGVQIYSGQLLSRSAYQKHWEFVSGGHRTVLKETEWQSMIEEQGFCSYFSDGDGSTTYRMPLVKSVHPKFVSALLEAGGYTEAGLPEISGKLEGLMVYSDLVTTGAFFNNGYTVYNYTGSQAGRVYRTGFNASSNSPIYGRSDTVQPEAISIIIGEYVIGTIAEIGEANAESLLASVSQLEAGKLDKTGGGVSGNLSVSGDLFVGGQINASISGTSENAVKASQDAQGRVIDETYSTKQENNTLEKNLRDLIQQELSKYLPLDGSSKMLNSLIAATGTTGGAIQIPYENIEIGTLPETNQYTAITFTDVLGTELGRILTFVNASGMGGIAMSHKNYKADTEWTSIAAFTRADGTDGYTVGGKDIVAVQDYNFALNKAYIRFTNGLLIHFGYVSSGSQAQTINFSPAFTSVSSYSCVCSNAKVGAEPNYNPGGARKSGSVYSYNTMTATSTGCYYIAIGY